MRTPLGCTVCGRLERPDGEPTPFEIFGLEPAWDLRSAQLKRRLLALQRLAHPDFHGTADPATRALAEQHAARINHSYEVLERSFLRADWLVAHLSGPSEREERAMPPEFLADVLEWNEQLEEAGATPTGSPAREALAQLARELSAKREAELARIGALLQPLPTPGDPVLREARKRLNAVRYLSRALWRIRELRFDTNWPDPADSPA